PRRARGRRSHAAGARRREPLGRALGRPHPRGRSTVTLQQSVARKDRGVRVLHVQKVAGISGSEAHLLSLLPRLRERGWDVRVLMLHEHEPGAWSFARALTDRGVPLDEISLRADVDPFAFVRLTAYLARRRPDI